MSATVSPLSTRFASAYIVTMRPYLLFVSGVTGIMGLSLGPGIGLGDTLLLGAVSFLSYGFGQALTDCFQLDTDRLSAPYRPLVQGLIRRRDVLTVSLAGLTLCGAILAAYFPGNLFLATLAVLGLATYTPFKRRWWAGPFYNAWIVTLLVVISYLAAMGNRAATAPAAGSHFVWMAVALALTFFGYANFVLTGYFKDISADRATGYATLPVRFGLRIAAAVSHVFAGASLAAGIAIVQRAPSAIALLFLVGGTAATLLGQFRLVRVRDERMAHRAIGPVVHAYLLLHAAVVVAAKPDWAIPLLVFYAAFGIVMRLRPMKEQI